MTVSKKLVLSLAFIAIAFPGALPEPGVTLAAPDDPPPCDSTALAVLKAARLEARAHFWIRVGQILNEPDCDAEECLEKAKEERGEAFALALEQYEARLDACEQLGQDVYDPDIEPEEFSSDVTHPYFPLVVGRTLVYREETDEEVETVRVTTLDEVVDIDGFPCRSVRDVVTVEGETVEDTIDFFSQREDGQVWYMGEVSKSFKNGFLDSLEGSWRADKHGAEPGIVMLATPNPGDVYRQEFLLNEAEDLAKVISLDETVEVVAGKFEHCIQTEEWNVNEPGGVEWKFYAPGIGFVLEVNPETGSRLELVDVIE